jgi:membrane fusion protein (multidrug efflux system)
MRPGEERTPIMGQNVRTRVIVSLGVLALGLVLLRCFTMLPVAHSQTKPGTPSAPPATVSVIEVSPKALPLYTEYTGTTDALETAEIRARVDGFIEQKFFNGGQVIKAGDRLYLLDQRTFIAEVQKAKAAVAKAEADLRYAKEGVEVFRAESRLAQSRAALINTEQDVARYTPLVKEQAASQQDLDASIAQRDVAREEVAARKTELTQTKLTQRTQIALATAELEAARAVLRLAELNLGYTDIRAPVAGRIAESDAFIGSLATQNSPEPLTLLSPLDPIQVKVRVGERDYLNYTRTLSPDPEVRQKQIGASFHFQLLLGDGSVYPYPGRFRSGDRAVDPQTGTLEITLDFPNPQATLLPGIFSRVKIQTGEKSGVFLVPQRAVTELQGIRTVYVVGKEEKVEKRTVTATERLGNLWAIEKGLEAGDRVIVEGIQRVQPDMKVNVKTVPEPEPQPQPQPQSQPATRSSAR